MILFTCKVVNCHRKEGVVMNRQIVFNPRITNTKKYIKNDEEWIETPHEVYILDSTREGDVIRLQSLSDLKLIKSLIDLLDFLIERKLFLQIDEYEAEHCAFNVGAFVDFETNLLHVSKYYTFLKTSRDLIKYTQKNNFPITQKKEPQVGKNGSGIGRPRKTRELEKAHRFVKAWEKAGEKPNVKLACEMSGVTRQAYYNYIKSKKNE